MRSQMLSILALGVAAGVVWGQEVVSARAGLIHHVEGEVFLGEKAMEQTPATKMFSQFPEVKENQVLRTGEGRAEILLSPGVVLRVGENAAVKMISSKLTDIVVELVEGAAVLDATELLKDNAISVRVKNAIITPRKAGVYKIHADDPGEVMVYEGQAEVNSQDERKIVKKSLAQALAEPSKFRKFDVEKGDALLRWSQRRGGYLAMANVSAAKSVYDSGSGIHRGMWYWNPFFGLYTFIPSRGVVCNSFYGYCFYSPARVYAAYYRPPPVYNSGFNDARGGGGVQYGYDRNAGYAVSSQRTYSDYSPGPSVSAPAVAAGGGGVRGGETAAPRSEGGGGRSQ